MGTKTVSTSRYFIPVFTAVISFQAAVAYLSDPNLFLLKRDPSSVLPLQLLEGIRDYKSAKTSTSLMTRSSVQTLLPELEPAGSGRLVSHRVKRGEDLNSVFKLQSVDSEEASKAISAWNLLKDQAGPLRTGEVVDLLWDESGRVTTCKVHRNDGRSVLLNKADHDGFSGTILKDEIQEIQRVVSGQVGRSFAISARKASIPAEVIDSVVDILSEQVEFRRDLVASDTFSVIYTEYRDPKNRRVRVGPISAASITSRGNPVFAIRHVGRDGRERYFDEKGKPLGATFLRYPVSFTKISSVFSDSRLHPLLGIRRPHNGVDFAAPSGTPVRSVGDGVIVQAGYGRDTGNIVKIQHSDRYSTAYLHLSKIARGLRPGSRVSQGQIIGAVGMTGLATGPHLHFSLYDHHQYVDPLKTTMQLVVAKENMVPPTFLQAAVQTLERTTANSKLASIASKDKRV